MARRGFVAGNWKMNGDQESITALLSGLSAYQGDAEMAVFPPFVYLNHVAKALAGSSVVWGAQTVCAEAKGAFTGEVSVSMLQDFVCEYVIVGHSERRTLYGETNECVARQFEAALRGQIKPILCVGETLAEREAGETLKIIGEQLAVARQLQDNLPNFAQAVIAYEPIWAIGTGQVATPEQAQEVHAFIREQLGECGATMRILYGGSVKPSNAAALFAMPDIDGALVGGASLKADQFIEIGQLCKLSSS